MIDKEKQKMTKEVVDINKKLKVKCVSKVLGQMWALLALRGVPGLLRHILFGFEKEGHPILDICG